MTSRRRTSGPDWVALGRALQAAGLDPHDVSAYDVLALCDQGLDIDAIVRSFAAAAGVKR